VTRRVHRPRLNCRVTPCGLTRPTVDDVSATGTLGSKNFNSVRYRLNSVYGLTFRPQSPPSTAACCIVSAT